MPPVKDSTYDAIIIGGGPGGTTVANYLAQAGKSALILERDKFPRFHIGESLLPYNREIFEELGLLELIGQGGFVTKNGAQIGLWDGSKHGKIIFKDGSFTEENSAFQVERSRFDKILLDRVIELGVDVREETEVSGYEINADSVTVTDKSGGTFQGKYLVDASGTVNFTGNRERIKTHHPKLRKIAVFTHYQGVADLPGSEAGDIQIFRHPKAWFWMIPLGGGLSSVGIVFDKDLLKNTDLSPQELYRDILSESQALVNRLQGASEVRPLQAMVDFSYANERLVSERLIRVGDSAGFLDPIFSSGVYLAMLMGKSGADALLDAMSRDNESLSPKMHTYEKTMLKNMKLYRDLIIGFYRVGFFELLINPEGNYLRLPCALNAILAGRLDQPWPVRWRVHAFQLLARIQEKIALVPRTGLRQD